MPAQVLRFFGKWCLRRDNFRHRHAACNGLRGGNIDALFRMMHSVFPLLASPALAACCRRAAFLFACCFVLASCNNSMEEINDLTSRARVGQDKGEDVTILYSVAGKVKARLFAHTFIRNESADPPYTEMKDGLRADFFNDSVQLKSTVTARYGRYYEREGNVLLRDSVHVVNDKGDQLDTQELVWNEKMQKFFTEKPVRITTPSQVLIGTGMVASRDFSDYQFTNVRGSVQLEKGQVPE